MRSHLAKYGVKVELRKRLVAITQDADTVTAIVGTSEPGAAETQETIVAQYLIGADGARGALLRISTTRLIHLYHNTF